MPDLTPAFTTTELQQIREASHEVLSTPSFSSSGNLEDQRTYSEATERARFLATIDAANGEIRAMQREKALSIFAVDEAFATGRKQGWQDAGLSLDAQEVLAARLATPDVAE